MKNLLLCIIPTLIMTLAFIVAIIILLIKHSKTSISISFVLLIGVIVFIYFSMPYLKDAKEKETLTFVGVYTTYISNGSGNPILCSKNIFENESNEIYVRISNFQFSKYNLKKGKKYKIVYYKSSHAVHSIESIE